MASENTDFAGALVIIIGKRKTTRPMTATALVDEENNSPFSRLTQKTALVILLIVLPIQFAFIHAGYPGRGRAAAICTGMIVTVVWMRWNLKDRVWFWATIASMLLLHVPLVFMVSWTDRSYPGVALLPLALLDFALIYGVLKVVEVIDRSRRMPSLIES